jgi:hypothetical protein
MTARGRDWTGVRELLEEWLSRRKGRSPGQLAELNAEFAQKLRAAFPLEEEDIRHFHRAGLLLFATFEFALRCILNRTDLSDGDKAEALNDAEDFCAGFGVTRDAPDGLVSSKIAFDLAAAALFLGLQAGLGPDEVKRLHQQLRHAHGSRGGTTSGKRRGGENRKWVPHARELAERICSKHPSWSDGKIAGEITLSWKLEPADCPGYRTLEGFVSDQRTRGKLPQRTR